ncbi:hypothetical protein PCE1_000635 [Barthelona sp. PCE]
MKTAVFVIFAAIFATVAAQCYNNPGICSCGDFVYTQSGFAAFGITVMPMNNLTYVFGGLNTTSYGKTAFANSTSAIFIGQDPNYFQMNIQTDISSATFTFANAFYNQSNFHADVYVHFYQFKQYPTKYMGSVNIYMSHNHTGNNTVQFTMDDINEQDLDLMENNTDESLKTLYNRLLTRFGVDHTEKTYTTFLVNIKCLIYKNNHSNKLYMPTKDVLVKDVC